jgi:hypothetical protein
VSTYDKQALVLALLLEFLLSLLILVFFHAAAKIDG